MRVCVCACVRACVRVYDVCSTVAGALLYGQLVIVVLSVSLSLSLSLSLPLYVRLTYSF